MNRITILLCLCVCVAFCGKVQTVNAQNSNVVDGAVESDFDYWEIEETEEVIAHKKFWKQKIDSVCIFVQNSEKLSIPEKANAINGFFTISTCWSSDYDVNRDSLIAVAISSLMGHPDIVKYNVTEILTNKNFEMNHSSDNRLWNIGWLCDCAVRGTNMIGLLCWRDKNNQPQGCLGIEDFYPTWSGWYHTVSKLRSKKDLYLLQSPWYMTVVELKNEDIIKTAFEIYIDWREDYYQFDEKTQKLTMYKSGYGNDEKGSIQKILKFNGKKFVTIFESKDE